MKARWLLATAALAPFAVAVLALQSCGGEGGPIGGGGGIGGDTALVAQFKALWTDSQTAGATYVGSETCGSTGCHGTRNGDDKYATWHETRHFGENVGCESCHGPGSAHVASNSKEDIMTFPKITNSVVCGQCHPQYGEWVQSKHRQLVLSPVQNASANPGTYGKSARCIACHSGLFRTQIYEKGVDVAAMDNAKITEIADQTLTTVPHIATCATCHDPHKKTGNLNKNGEDVQLRHKVHNEDPTDILPGTVATTFTYFDHACAECHNGRGANGADSALTSGTARPNMHDSNQYNMLAGVGGAEGTTGPVQRNMAHFSAEGQCSKCHMPNARHSFTVSYDTSCVPCHTPADAAQRKATLESEMLNRLFVLRTRMENYVIQTYTPATPGYTPAEMDQRLFPYLWDYSSSISAAASELGIDTGNAANMPPTTHQASLPVELKRARHNYYFILRDSSICPHNPPYARYLMDYANAQMDDLFGLRPERQIPNLSSAQKLRIIEADRERARQADRNALEQGDGD